MFVLFTLVCSFSYLTPAFSNEINNVSEDCCVEYRGNVDSDTNDIIDISDLIYLVDFSFGDPKGPEPACFEEADLDGSSMIDITDLVYLVDFMFRDRPKPYNCEDMQIDLNLGTKIIISMQEVNGQLKLDFRTQDYFPCAGYTINSSFNVTGNTYSISFNSVSPPFGICWTVILPASGSQQLGVLANGTYTLNLNNGAPLGLQLIVTDEYYQLIGEDVRQFYFMNQILYKTE